MTQSELKKIRDEMAKDISMCDDDPCYYKKYPEIWELVYDLDAYSRYSIAMNLTFSAGFDAASELHRELLDEVEKFLNINILRSITGPKVLEIESLCNKIREFRGEK